MVAVSVKAWYIVYVYAGHSLGLGMAQMGFHRTNDRYLIGTTRQFMEQTVDAVLEKGIPTCAACGTPYPPKKCSRCRSVGYCNDACQTDHWRDHKQECKKKTGK